MPVSALHPSRESLSTLDLVQPPAFLVLAGPQGNGWMDARRTAVAELRHKDVVLLSFTRSLMTYALGRRVEAADMPAVRRIIRNAATQDYRLSAFVTGIVESDAFRMARIPAAQRQSLTEEPRQ